MPYQRPGLMYYTKATKVVNHGAPCVEDGIAGVAVKQQAAPFGTGPGSNPALVQVQIGEQFAMITKGVVQVPFLAGTAKGMPVYVVTADNSLNIAATGAVKFGRVVETPNDTTANRGLKGTTLMRVDLDKRDSF